MAQSLRTSCLVAILVIVVPLAVPIAQTKEPGPPSPFVGTWVLNLAKSTYDGARRKKESTRTLDMYGEGRIVATHRRTIENGNDGFSYWVGNLRGEPFPEYARQRRGAPGNTVSITEVDSHAWRVTFRNREGRVVLTDTWTVSADGRTLTIDRKGLPANGPPTHSVEVYENDGFARPGATR